MRFVHAVTAVVLVFHAAPACAQESLFRSAPGSPFAVEGNPSIARLADFDRDGQLDFVIAVSADKAVRVFRGDGDGSFDLEPSARASVPLEPTELATADLNGDGLTDVAVGSHDSYNIWMFFGDGRGGLSPSTEPLQMRQGERPHTHGLLLADVNEDGLVDVVTVNNEDNDVAVMLSEGDGRFVPAPGSPFPVGPSPYPAGIGDANADGFLDIAVPSTVRSGEGRVEILVGDGEGGFTSGRGQLKTQQPWMAAIEEESASGDKGAGRVLLAHWERARISVLEYDQETSEWREVSGSPFSADVAAFEITVADVNRDGRSDVVGVAGDQVGVLLGQEGGFRSAPGSPYPVAGGAWRLDVGDLNGDGRLDIVAPGAEANVVSVLLGR